MILDLNTYKSLKGINPANTNQDTQITALISSVSSAIISYIGRDLTSYYTSDKTEYFTGSDAALYVSEYPIKEGSVAVSYKDSSNTYQPLVEDTDYYVDYEMDRIISVSGNSFMSIPKPRAVMVVYMAGYADWPLDIKMAAAELVEFYLKQEKSPNKTMGGAETMQFVVTPQGRLPNHIATILDLYRVPVR